MSKAGWYRVSVDDRTIRDKLIALRLKEKLARDALMYGRIEAGKLINAVTAEIGWLYASNLDPYCEGLPDQPHIEDWSYIGREYFARTPGGVWVAFRDLPAAMCQALWARPDSSRRLFPELLIPDAGPLQP